MNGWSIAFTVVAVAAFGCAVWAIFIERVWFAIRDEQQSVAILPRGSQPIRVLHISDFHFAPWQRRKQGFVRALADLDVDLVINTGDNLGHRNAVEITLDALSGLLKKPGGFANGSNDYFVPTPRNPFTYLIKPTDRHSEERLPTDQLVGAFEAAGWANLNNQGASLTIKGSKLRLVGVDDRHEHLAKLETVAANAADLQPNETLIGVTHAPYLDVIDSFASAGVEVLFAVMA